MTISLRLDADDSMLFKKYAALKGISVSEMIRQTVFEKIEDEYDLATYKKALADYKKKQVTYSLDEIEKELGLK